MYRTLQSRMTRRIVVTQPQVPLSIASADNVHVDPRVTVCTSLTGLLGPVAKNDVRFSNFPSARYQAPTFQFSPARQGSGLGLIIPLALPPPVTLFEFSRELPVVPGHYYSLTTPYRSIAF